MRAPKKMHFIRVSRMYLARKYYSQLSLRRTPLGPALSVLVRFPSYRESNKGSKERQGPTLGVRFTEVSIL